MKILSTWARLPFIYLFALLSSQLHSQPIDFSTCADCSAADIGFLTKVVTFYQGINGFNPSAPSTYNLIGNRKFSGTAYSITNSFFGENWYPIRTEKQTLTGTLHDFYGLRYANFVVPLVKTVQEQQQQIGLLLTSIKSTDGEIAELRKKIEVFEKLINQVSAK